jgi:hypothetical protein
MSDSFSKKAKLLKGFDKVASLITKSDFESIKRQLNFFNCFMSSTNNGLENIVMGIDPVRRKSCLYSRTGPQLRRNGARG